MSTPYAAEVIGPGAGTLAFLSGHPDTFHDRDALRGVAPLSRREQERERSPASLAGQVSLLRHAVTLMPSSTRHGHLAGATMLSGALRPAQHRVPLPCAAFCPLGRARHPHPQLSGGGESVSLSAVSLARLDRAFDRDSPSFTGCPRPLRTIVPVCPLGTVREPVRALVLCEGRNRAVRRRSRPPWLHGRFQLRTSAVMPSCSRRSRWPQAAFALRGAGSVVAAHRSVSVRTRCTQHPLLVRSRSAPA